MRCKTEHLAYSSRYSIGTNFSRLLPVSCKLADNITELILRIRKMHLGLKIYAISNNDLATSSTCNHNKQINYFYTFHSTSLSDSN